MPVYVYVHACARARACVVALGFAAGRAGSLFAACSQLSAAQFSANLHPVMDTFVH